MKAVEHQSKWILLCLLILVGMTAWIKHKSSISVASGTSASRSIPKFFLTEVRMDRFNSQGKLQSQLNADSLTNYGSDTILVRPELTLKNRSSTSTNVGADEATLLSKNLIELRGNVSFKKNDSDGKSKIAFSSSSALVDLKSDTVITENLTTTSFGEGNGKSVGAKFYNSTGILKLTSRVSMHYTNRTKH
jgi:LPS export ABC transporter protein LptC